MPIQSLKDKSIVEMEAKSRGILSAVTTAIRIYRPMTLGAEKPERGRGNMETQKLDLDFLDVKIQDAPNDQILPTNRICGGKVRNFYIIDGIVRAKILIT